MKYFKWGTPEGQKSYLISPEEYKSFESTPMIIRGFCRECSCSLVCFNIRNNDVEILAWIVEDIKASYLKISEAVSPVFGSPNIKCGAKMKLNGDVGTNDTDQK